MKTIDHIKIFFDGACRNVKGKSSEMGIGVAVFINHVYEHDFSLAIGKEKSEGRGTNNVAEWLGAVEAMKLAGELRKLYPQSQIKVYSDSQIIANQFNGTYAIKEESFKIYFTESWKHAKVADVRMIEWIPRELNKEADKLSKEGLSLIRNELGIVEKPKKTKKLTKKM